MANLNKVFLIGNLTRDPQQRFLPSGQGVVEFGIATNRKFTANGEKREEVTFVDIEAWGQQGDLIAKYLKKGNPVFVEGRLKFDSWQTKEGEKRNRLRVVVERFEFLGGGQGRGTGAPGAEMDPSDFGIDPSASGGRSAPMEAAGGESDVPF